MHVYRQLECKMKTITMKMDIIKKVKILKSNHTFISTIRKPQKKSLSPTLELNP